MKQKVALFDLDGVIFDTEPQYSVFWKQQCNKYRPEEQGLENAIKGQTLDFILDKLLPADSHERALLIAQLNRFERNMQLNYVSGWPAFAENLRQCGVKIGVVTSSNNEKMLQVYAKRPEFKALVDKVLTAENFAFSKPHPDPYLKGAAAFGALPAECVVFEDSFNGLKSGRAAGMHVVGLSTTNAAQAISPLCDVVIDNFSDLTVEQLFCKLSGLTA